MGWDDDRLACHHGERPTKRRAALVGLIDLLNDSSEDIETVLSYAAGGDEPCGGETSLPTEPEIVYYGTFETVEVVEARRRRVVEMQSPDTASEARAVQLRAYRAMAPVDRLETALTMSDEVMAISAAGIRRRHPALSAGEATAELHRILGHPRTTR